MLLLTKMLRDMWQSRFQFIAIFIMSALGVLIFSGLESIRLGMIRERDWLYEQANLADIWVNLSGEAAPDLSPIGALAGVRRAGARMFTPVPLGEGQLALYVQDTGCPGAPIPLSGDAYDAREQGIWLAQPYAEAHNYRPGDTIDLLGKKLVCRGLILSGEHVYFPAPGSFSSNFTDYGYAYISPGTARDLLGDYAPNQILLLLEADADRDEISKLVQLQLGDQYGGEITRENLLSVEVLANKIDQLGKFAYIFSALFFMLALLTTMTTMTRLVENQRQQIGILMSQGYEPKHLTCHYASYGLGIGLLGGGAGVLAGRGILAFTLLPTFKRMFTLPHWRSPLTLSSLISVIVITLVCLTAVILSCRGKLKDFPAVITRGKASKGGRYSYFERHRFCRGLSLVGKSTVRNISRNKVRSLMGIVGVFGCMMLILAGLGSRHSVTTSLDMMFSHRYRYKALLEPDADLPSLLAISPETQPVQEGPMEITFADKAEKVQFTVLGPGDLAQVLDDAGETVTPPPEGIALSAELADARKIKAGDGVTLRLADQGEINTTVAAIYEVVLPKQVYFSQAAWENLGQEFRPTAIMYGNTPESALAGLNGIEQVVSKDKQKNDAKEILKSTSIIVTMIVLCAIMLGVTVIANLGLLNYTEMAREYATLKVLGFYPKEIRLLALWEQISLTAVGFVLGIPAGWAFLKAYMRILSSENQVFFPHISLGNILLAAAITITCALGVNLVLSRKINKVDMVAALKSAE